VVTSQQRRADRSTITWSEPVEVPGSIVTVLTQVADGQAVARVNYCEQPVSFSAFGNSVRALREPVMHLGESTDGPDFRRTVSLSQAGRKLICAFAYDASGRLVGYDEIAVQIPAGAASPVEDVSSGGSDGEEIFDDLDAGPVPSSGESSTGGSDASPAASGDDRFEENDTRVAAASIDAGSYADLQCKDEDWYAVSVGQSASLRVRIEFQHSAGDLDMKLQRANGNQVSSSTSTSNRETVRGADLAAGTYYVRVFGYRNAQAPYSLTVTVEGGATDVVADTSDSGDDEGAVVVDSGSSAGSGGSPVGGGSDAGSASGDDAFEENDTRASAASVAAGTHGDLQCNDEDWFAVAVGPGASLTVRIDFQHSSGDLDMKLQGPGGNQIASSVSTSNHETVRGADVAAGTYYVRVYGYRGARAPYSLTVTVQGGGSAAPPASGGSGAVADSGASAGSGTSSGDDRFEENDSRAAAAAIGRGVHAGLKCLDDDWFAITLAQGERLVVSVSFQHAAGDIDIRLNRPSGARLSSSTSVSNRERIEITAQEAGTYTLRVYGYSGATNDYELRIE
jgi:hypothetical protein